MRLADRIVVITGAGSGLGRAGALAFGREGARVVASDLDPASTTATVEAVRAAGGQAIGIPADAGDRAGAKHLIDETVARLGGLDVLYNNAGIAPVGRDGFTPNIAEDDWEQVIRVNLTSVYLCCKYVLPYMREQGKGSIINTASFVAVMGAATSQISYTASKGGVLAMSRELGVQFAREGIRVNALCPGPVATPMLLELFAKDPERAARRLVHVPVGRFAEPSEIAAAVAFLASDDASFITASEFLVDGGISGAYVTPL